MAAPISRHCVRLIRGSCDLLKSSSLYERTLNTINLKPLTRTFLNSEENNYRLRWKKLSIICAGIGVGTCIGVYAFSVLKYKDSSNRIFFPFVKAAQVYDEGTSSSGPPRSERFNFIADIVEKIQPAVVYIETQGRHPFHGGFVTTSNGSGFIIKSDGLILTNAHVVANKVNVSVKLFDGRVFSGVVEEVDPHCDLATVRIKCKELPVIELGNSSKLRPGEWVVAMGSPLSLSNTITAGIVSSVSRGGKELGLKNRDVEYIQTDAAINFGNSGGPLVNLDGKAIGINTMKVTAGISFAIPADRAKSFLQAIEQKQKGGWFGSSTPTTPRRYYMGITMLTLTPAIIQELQRRHFSFPDIQSGVLVHSIVVGSPAHRSGLQKGDILTHINSKPITSSADIFKLLETDQEFQLTVLRNNYTLSLIIRPELVQ